MYSHKNVCVIGAGASGLCSIKCCLDAGFKVTCYEQSDSIGGLWKYRDEDVDGIASVARSTVINSSKEMSAYSDFPPPPEFANYMHNTKMFEYFEMYAKQFDLQDHIQFERKIIRCEKNDTNEAGLWKITTQNTKTKETHHNVYDAVMVCTGHHVKPLVPSFQGQEKFKGQIIHSHSYKKPLPYDDKTVVVVGIGNSGGDIAVELSSLSKKVYHSIRRGNWSIWRSGSNGYPTDSEYIRRSKNFMTEILPFEMTLASYEKLINGRVDHELYGLKPKHRVLGQHLFVNDIHPNKILNGTIVLKNGIKEFTENGVIFEYETKETPCDAVILATGYDIHFPFLDKDIVWSEDGRISLYKHVFSPRLEHPDSLSIIGMIQPLGPLVPISELQARWHVEILKGNRKLPDKETMLEDIKKKRDELDKRYYKSPRHLIQVDFLPFMDELASEIGAKPNLFKILFTDFILWYHLWFGPSLSYQYRLDGPHSWPGAREAILTWKPRVEAAFKTRKPDTEPECKTSTMNHIIILCLPILFWIIFQFFQ
ncbi:flavin-containing monooxygenase 5-like [Brevipalpus obovatus]|uniref:flavin-containing monooxygenase 5-like n=1 Tax=Brevipalpus obovatus TaxID=246614 RepID=UPI003D9DCDCD